jgi:hypothetical protein
MNDIQYNGVKVFSASKAEEREQLGERVTAWLGLHPEVDVRRIQTLQSSDKAFHCITIVVMYQDPSF